MMSAEILIFFGIWLLVFSRVLKLIWSNELNVMNDRARNPKKKYNSFDGSIREFKNGGDYFAAIEYEKNKIRTSGRYNKLLHEIHKLPLSDKEINIKNLNRWILPHNIFLLTPGWWEVNDIQDESPAVSAFIQIVKEEIEKT